MRREPSSLNRQILAVAVPAFFALVTEPLMLLADTAVVGHLGTPELAGLSVAGTVLTTVVGLCVFLAYGTTSAVARSHGAGHEAESFGLAVAGLWLAAAVGVGLGLVLAVAAGPITAALSSSPEVAEHAQTYLVISSAGVPSMLLLLAATGALRGILDLRSPLIVAVLANVANIVLNIVLVYGLDLGIAGAALGTVLAQTGGALCLVTIVVRRAREADAPIGPHVGAIVDSARRGVPLLARTALLRASLLLATAVAATLGDAPLAAHQIAVTLVSLLTFALDAIAIAGQTLTGRSLGAGDVEQTRRFTNRMIWWGAGSGATFGVTLAGASSFIGPWFTPDTAVHAPLVPALLVVALIQPVSGIVFVLDGVLIGAGDGVYLAWAGLITLVCYAPVALTVAALEGTLAWLWAAYCVFVLSRLATLWHRQRDDAWMTTGT